MKKTSFVIAILASALLAGACGGKKDDRRGPGCRLALGSARSGRRRRRPDAPARLRPRM